MIVLLCSGILRAQTPDSAIAALVARVHDQLERNNPPHMQLTTDKAVYVPRETVWFRTYEPMSDLADTQIHVLYVFLTDAYRHRPLLSGRFVMRKGLASGSFTIPDSLEDGAYTIVAYPDRLLQGAPNAVVYRTIHIRSMRSAALSILSFDDYPLSVADSLLLKYLVTGQTGIVSNAEVRYYLYADARLRDSGMLRTNSMGEINMRLKTLRSVTDCSILLHAKKDTLSKTVIFDLPVNGDAKAPSIAAYEDRARRIVDVTVSNLRTGDLYLVAAFNGDLAAAQDSFILVRRSGVVHLQTGRLQPGDLRLELYDKDAKRVAATLLKRESGGGVVEVRADTAVYGDRSLVKVRLRALDGDGRPAKGLFSLKCVYKKRLSESQSTRYLDTAVVIPAALTSVGFGGRATSSRKRDPRSPGILVTGGSGWANFATDSMGRFLLDPDLITGSDEKRIMIAVSENAPSGYKLTLSEPDRPVNALLSRLYYPVSQELTGAAAQDFAPQEMAQWRGMLKAVVVRAKRTDEYGAPDFFDPNCSGYVCSCDHWMCDGCPPKLQPVPGRAYFFRSSMKTFVYRGCGPAPVNDYIKLLDPILQAKPFPVFDPQKSPTRDLYTTLYWNPFVALDDKGEAVVSFYTNDLQGRFAVEAEALVDGVGVKGVTTFDVK